MGDCHEFGAAILPRTCCQSSFSLYSGYNKIKDTPMLKQVLVEAIAIASGSAAAAGLDDVMVLEPLLVTSPLSESDWLTLPMAVSATAAEDQPGEQLLSLDSLLAPIPGTVSGSVRLNRVRHH